MSRFRRSAARCIRPARPAAAAVLVVLGLLWTACAASEPPPTSPFDDGHPEPTAPPGVATGTPPPLGTPGTTPSPGPGVEGTAVPGGSAPAAPAGGDDHEAVVARAIDLIAEWLDMPATDLQVASVEEVEWGNACLGVERPYMACADVVTTGVRVELQTLLGASVHAVHISDSGRAFWAHDRAADGEIVDMDVASGTLLVEVAGGQQTWMVVPGSELDVPLASFTAGTAITAGLDGTADGEAVVWMMAR